MIKTKYLILTLTLATTFLSGCLDRNSIANSDKYYNEEIIAYNDILNEIIDSTDFNNNAVFFLFDTLCSIDNSKDKEYKSDIKYLNTKFEKRQFSTDLINGIKKFKFIKATKYPKDTIINETNFTILQDSLNLKKNEQFTHDWVTFSRICFNSEMTQGFLYFNIWCGDLCAWGDRLDIEKIKGKWKVCKRYRGPVS